MSNTLPKTWDDELERLDRELDTDPTGRVVRTVAAAVAERGGQVLLVGGVVRDALLGLPTKDFDVEVSHLDLSGLEEVLSEFGEVIQVGRSFGVLRVKGLEVDFSLPRRDNKHGPGHRGFSVSVDTDMDFRQASQRRDLTINSMGYDLLNRELLDPHGGCADLEQKRLRATDPTRFSEDPLRGLRAAQFAARFEMNADDELISLCSQLDLSELPGERCFEEFRKLLLKGRQPSLGLSLLERTGMLRFFPELAALVGVPQDPEWHPEGDVWVHTLRVVDVAARLRHDDDPVDLALMWAALCHDLGKPATTETQDGRVRSKGHDVLGAELTRNLLERLRAPATLVTRTEALVRHHLAPALFDAGGASERAYRRLARKLDASGVDMKLLERVARSDHLGRTTPDALAGEFQSGDTFLVHAQNLEIDQGGTSDVVLGRHLIARGFTPGPRFGEILAACRDQQDDTGDTDPDSILDTVLARISFEGE
ncbi:HD domain-containing protein [Myxococcota bacterium]|nr:HD domain-containing protein [Myxococcota bacterium]